MTTLTRLTAWRHQDNLFDGGKGLPRPPPGQDGLQHRRVLDEQQVERGVVRQVRHRVGAVGRIYACSTHTRYGTHFLETRIISFIPALRPPANTEPNTEKTVSGVLSPMMPTPLCRPSPRARKPLATPRTLSRYSAYVHSCHLPSRFTASAFSPEHSFATVRRNVWRRSMKLELGCDFFLSSVVTWGPCKVLEHLSQPNCQTKVQELLMSPY